MYVGVHVHAYVGAHVCVYVGAHVCVCVRILFIFIYLYIFNGGPRRGVRVTRAYIFKKIKNKKTNPKFE